MGFGWQQCTNCKQIFTWCSVNGFVTTGEHLKTCSKHNQIPVDIDDLMKEQK